MKQQKNGTDREYLDVSDNVGPECDANGME